MRKDTNTYEERPETSQRESIKAADTEHSVRFGLLLSSDDKYAVDVLEVPRAIPVPKESVEAMKGAVKGAALGRMKREAVDCPVKAKRVSFVECFTCSNFNRRVKGKVGCTGLPGGEQEEKEPEAPTEDEYTAI